MSRPPYDLYRDLGASPAPARARMSAALVDTLLLGLVGGVAFLGFGLQLVSGESPAAVDPDGMSGAGPVARGVDAMHVAILATPVFLVWLWNRVVRVSQGGASFGMGLLGIRLVSVRTGTSPTADQAVIRSLVGLALSVPAFAGLLSIFTHHQRRGLHDLASGVVLIAPPE